MAIQLALFAALLAALSPKMGPLVRATDRFIDPEGKFMCGGCSSCFSAQAGVLAVRWMRDVFPFDPTEASRKYDFRQLQSRYGALRWWTVLLALPLVAAATFGWFVLLQLCAEWFGPRNPQSQFVIHPTPWFWLLPAMFFGIFTGGLLTSGVFALWLGDDYHEFEIYDSWVSGIDSKRTTRYCISPIMMLLFLLTVPVFRMGTVVNNNEIRVHRYLSWNAEAKPFTEIKEVFKIERPPGKGNCPDGCFQYYVAFQDGSLWSTSASLHDDRADDEKIYRFIADRAGKSIRRYKDLEHQRHPRRRII